MIYLNYQTPARYQPGDLVTGDVTYHEVLPSGTTVVGEIIAWTNWEAKHLNSGDVQVKTEDGRRPWIKVIRLITTAQDLHHPAGNPEAILAVRITCGCGKKFEGTTFEIARSRHQQHAKRETN